MIPLWNKHKKTIGSCIFWFAFFCELLFFTLKKFDIDMPHQSLILRGICGLFCLKILLTDYTKKEWLIIIFCGVLGVTAYFASGRGIDILFRAAAMVAASKDISRRRAFQILFYALFITDFWIILQGFLGNKMMVDVRDYGRGTVEARYTFGFSHANTFHFAMWSLMTLCIYLYHSKLKVWHYTVFAILGALITWLTRSRTGGGLMLFTLMMFLLFTYYKPLVSYKRLLFAGSMLLLALCLGLSILTIISGPSGAFMHKLNALLTGRIQWAYNAVQDSFFSLFSQQGNELLIDMGYVRLIYSYGLVPALLFIIAIICILWNSCKTGDYLTYVFLLSLIIFTTIEAQQINCDIVYNYTLLMLFGFFRKHGQPASPL